MTILSLASTGRATAAVNKMRLLMVVLLVFTVVVSFTSTFHYQSTTTTLPLNSPAATPPLNLTTRRTVNADSPYHNWELFSTDFKTMLNSLKIYSYPPPHHHHHQDFPRVFLSHPNPFDPKYGNYHSEHMFKLSLLSSSLLTLNPHLAHFFFLPFSINALRNDPRVHSESSIARFVSQYTSNISREFPFWNASTGTDHFYVSCHSVDREAASQHPELRNNAIHATCSSSYFQRFYISRKDFSLPQVWPRKPEELSNTPHTRDKLLFFAGRLQNAPIRQQLLHLWGNDTSMDIFSTSPSYPYEDGFRRSKYCIHAKGYEVNTARVSDAIHYGCVPVILSNYYDLPFANVLDWTKFSVIIAQADISSLKKILLSISEETYISMYANLCTVRQHFVWNTKPTGYDSFHMTAYQLWLRRSTHISVQH